MKKMQTIEELRQYLETHQDDGRIDGQEVTTIREETVEVVNAFVPQDIYNQALLKASALAFSKSNLGTFALTQFLTDPLVNTSNKITPLDPGTYNREFPCFVPITIYDLAFKKAESLGLNISDLFTYSLNLFVNNQGINTIYEDYINDLIQTYGKKREYIEMKILGWRRYKSKQLRYQMSLEAGELIQRRKLPV